MSVVFEFQVASDFHFSSRFAQHFGLASAHNRVELPELLGEGFIQEVYLNNGLFLCMHNYYLKEEFILRRIDVADPELLTLKFDCSRLPLKIEGQTGQPLLQNEKGCEVEFGTSNHFMELKFPPHKLINFLVIGTTREAMLELLKLNEEESFLDDMLRDNSSFVLHECMTPEMERVLKHISQINEATKLATLLYQTKAQELIYLLISKLMGRPTPAAVTVDQADASKIYAVREAILADVTLTPQLPLLARSAGMSLTKMKLLFRQVFGDSIYNYYQAAKMNEAAYLLKSLTVSETGYKLGFSNLSHFTRLFEKHYEVKPKRFKDSLKAA